MFKIGEFSKLTRVTVKALRYYDAIGLLAPSAVDPLSGYRYYRAEQLPRLNRILALKDLGFSLEAIATLLDERTPTHVKARMFDDRRHAIERAIEQNTQHLKRLAALQADGQDIVCLQEHDVILRSVPSCSMATIRKRVPSLGEPVTELFERLEQHVAKFKARALASPLMILHDEEFRESDLEVETAVPITRPIGACDDIQIREVAGWPTMACIIYRGGYEQMGAVLQTLLTWSERHRMQIAGPLREVYLRFGANQEQYRLPPAFLTNRASDFVTEVQLPVSPGDSP